MNKESERSDYTSRKYLAGLKHAEQRRTVYKDKLEKAKIFLEEGKPAQAAKLLGQVLGDDPFFDQAREFAERLKVETGLEPRISDYYRAPNDESRLLHCRDCTGILDEETYERILRSHYRLFVERGMASAEEAADFMYIMLKLLEEGTIEAQADEHGVFTLCYRDEHYVLVQPNEADFARMSFDPMHFDRWGLKKA